MNHLQEVIENAWETRAEWDMRSASVKTRDAVEHAIQLLDPGTPVVGCHPRPRQRL